MIDFTLQSNKPVILVGPQAKPFRSIEAAVKMADKTKYATAVIPNAKVTKSACNLHLQAKSHGHTSVFAIEPVVSCITRSIKQPTAESATMLISTGLENTGHHAHVDPLPWVQRK